MIHLIMAVLLTVFLLYVAALYESTALAILAFLLAGLAAAAFLLVLWRLTALEVDLAIPMTLKQSTRLDVISYSNTLSRRPSSLGASAPIGASSFMI